MTNRIFNDIGYLSSLRAEAASAPNKAIKEVASQFEALFIQQMLKSMRDAVPKSDLTQSNHLDTYQSMADQQMAVGFSQQGGIGIARMLVEQMQSKGYVASSENSDADVSVIKEKLEGPLSALSRPMNSGGNNG
jgi:flagellar protein FlgJ